MTNKTLKQCLPKRIEILNKLDSDHKPSAEELEAAYGYLDYCLGCGKKFKFAEAFDHGFEGNAHKFDCGFWGRLLGRIYWVLRLIFMLVILVPFLIIEGIGWCVGKIIPRAKKYL